MGLEELLEICKSRNLWTKWILPLEMENSDISDWYYKCYNEQSCSCFGLFVRQNYNTQNYTHPFPSASSFTWGLTHWMTFCRQITEVWISAYKISSWCFLFKVTAHVDHPNAKQREVWIQEEWRNTINKILPYVKKIVALYKLVTYRHPCSVANNSNIQELFFMKGLKLKQEKPWKTSQFLTPRSCKQTKEERSLDY